jgi:hypothetical protein
MRNTNVCILRGRCRIDLLRSPGSMYKLAGARFRGESRLQDNGRREWRRRKAATAQGADNPNGRGSTWDPSPRMTGRHEQLSRGGCPLTPYKPKRLALNRPKRMDAIVCSLEDRRRSRHLPNSDAFARARGPGYARNRGRRSAEYLQGLSDPDGQLSVAPAGRAPGLRPQPPMPISPPPTFSPTARRSSRRRCR